MEYIATALCLDKLLHAIYVYIYIDHLEEGEFTPFAPTPFTSILNALT